MSLKHLLLKRRWLMLIMVSFLAGSAGMYAKTHFNNGDVHWISHNPTFAEPWFVVNLMIYDNDDKDSFFKHDNEHGQDEGPAVYVDNEYVGSPNYELAWPGWDNRGNYSDLEAQRKYDEWWGSVYSNGKCTIRFFNPYRESHGGGYFIRVKLYVFLKQWEVGKTHKVKVRGKWKINNNGEDWEEVTLTSKAFGNPWEAPSAMMSDYNTVSVGGPLPGSVASTEVGIYTQSQTAPSGFLDNSMFGASQKYAQSIKVYSGLSGRLERSDNSSDAFCASYKDAVNLPLQYSATYKPSGYIDSNGNQQATTVYTWFTVPVAGFIQPKDAKYKTDDQWSRQGTVSWSVVDTDGAGRALSAEGTWTVRNATKGTDIVSKIAKDARSSTITLDGYRQNESIEVYFVPDKMSTLRSELSAKTTAVVTPSWAFGDFSASEVTDGIMLKWTHNPIGDAAGDKPYTLYIQRSTDYEEGSSNATWADIATMTVASTSIFEGSYTDPGSGLEANKAYHYRLKVNVFGEDQVSAVASTKLSGSKILSFAASRGTYSTMVKLQWNVQQVGATICNFAIYRRPLGSGDEVNWRAIHSTSGTVTSYSYDDVTALPGSFYDYKLVLWTQDGEERSVNDAKTTDGFSVATGIISGNIAYGTGSAVEGAKVTLNQQDADGGLTSGLRSVQLLGHGAGFKYACDTKTLTELFGGDFSVQVFVNPEGNIPEEHSERHLLTDVYKAFTLDLRYDTGTKTYKVGVYLSGKTFVTDLTVKPGEWTHLTCAHSAATGNTTVYAMDSSGSLRSAVLQESGAPATIGVTIRDDDDCISVGNDASFKGDMYFSGFMDEFRFWTKALSERDVERNYNHPLSGGEGGLAIYYPFDEGLASQSKAYDFSRKDGMSNGRHATAFVPAASSPQLPGEGMMSLMAYTDVNGYYEVRGVPFSGDGTSYSITPTLGIHEFSPSTRSRFVSMSSLNHSGVDFEDVSSFPVSGKVYYAGTDYPVEGVNFYVDGIVCARDGEIITTNAKGEYTISVPIGDHFISVAKNGHVFASGGRYPPDLNDVGTKVNFNHEIKNMDFIDSTLVNFTGRVVGGSTEGNMKVGFGLSTNNIGVVEFVLTPVNETPRLNVVKQMDETTYSYETNSETVAVSSASTDVESTAWRGAGADDCRKIFIRTSATTGEFSALVPPLEYMVSAMKVMKTDMEVAAAQSIDMTNPLEQYRDTLYTDDGYKVYTFNKMLKQVYHSAPTFNVSQKGHEEDGLFGISSYTISDEIGELVVDDIYSLDDAGKPVYKYGGPVFEMYEPYVFNIEAYEEYVNQDDNVPVTFHVPLNGLIVTIDNALSDQQPVYMEDTTVNGVNVKGGQVAELQSNQLLLDSLGRATYQWHAGLPNITPPYTRTITISYDIDDRTCLWSGSGMEGIILGDMPTGSNFVTAGPDMLDMILRDPPGSKSSASWTSGTIKSTTKATLGAWDSDSHFKGTLKLGIKTTSAIGMGVVQVMEADSRWDQELGVKGTCVGEKGDTWSQTIEATKAISTSDDNSFVGACGDIFIGSATNVIIGKSRNVGFHRVDGGNEVALDLTDDITTGMKFGTMFNYTQSYIENQLLPNLTALRNGMLTTASQETIDSYVNNGKRPVYLTTLSPDDPNFGADNTGQVDSKGRITPSSRGNSYTMIVPQTSTEDYQDSVMWCNTQIKAWKSYLAMNEFEKVRAFENRENPDSVKVGNYSFDSGSNITNSSNKSESNGWKRSIQAMGYVILNSQTGFTTNGFGVLFDFGTESGGGYHQEDEHSTTDVANFSYTLAEEGDADAISVDVYEYGAFSPIFRTRGGQTSAPYEGQAVTKYHKPGTTIMEATMQIEVPQIDVDVPVITDIPSGTAANFTLRLNNNSEIATEIYYRLMQAEDTNPNGAQLFVDGKALTENRLIMIPPGETVTKILQLKQSDLSILDYDRIGIVLGAESQYQINYNWDVIADTVFISAHYVPSSSPVTLELSNNIMNTQTGTDLVLTMKDFDRTYRGLKAFRMQYKKQGATDWTLIHEYVLDEADKTTNNELLPATGATVSYRLPMAAFSDGDYLFRVVSASTYGADEVFRYSNEMALVKDLQRPTPIGIPEPSDGILDIGDAPGITFNESILKGELTPEANFRVTGVLNGTEIAHETALSVSGSALSAPGGFSAGVSNAGSALSAPGGFPAGVAAQTEAAINLAGKDFSFDMWVNLTSGAGALLSHGSGAARMTIGTDANGKLTVSIGSNTYTSESTVPTGKWAFLSLSLTADGQLNASVADDANETTLFKNKPVAAYSGNGPLSVGCGLTAAIHELLLWDEAHDMTTALVSRSKSKNPATRHLIGYWKMDEGEGTTIRDYARNRHLTMAAETWYLNNVNKAVSLDGQSFISIDASQLPVCVDDDYAIEFWMRGAQQTDEAQLVQMGDVALSLTADGILQLTSVPGGALQPDSVPVGFPDGSTFTTTATLSDNTWHHVALNVLRQGSAAVYVDGRRCLTIPNANVGSIATNNLIVGARRTFVNEAYTYDRPFTGLVDEIRVWNASLSGDVLASNRKVRLTGSEDGLVAYYPFEKKTLDEGNQVVTIGDATDLTGSGNTAQLRVLGGSPAEVSYTDDAPALRTKPTETNVSFTFVASDEKVVITINEEAAAIEGTTLNFTVRDVRDVNGNYSVPTSWSAFVNRKELAWTEETVGCICSATSGATLSATIVNKSGAQQMWTLSGMPSWLTASADYGTLNPLEETSVTFTVSPATPIGRYEETVYLKGNNGIETPLTLNVTVTGLVPDWAVNSSEYENSMNVIGRLEIHGVHVADEDDIVAAFIGEECRGVAHPAYMERYDNYFLTMDIYGSNDSDKGKEVLFRAYDASTGTLYPVVQPDRPILFESLALEGNYDAPVILTASDKIEQSTDLVAGWNWVSFYVKADSMTPDYLLKDIKDDVLAIKGHNSWLMRDSVSNQLKGNMTGELSNVEMYAINMNVPRTLRITGEPVDPATNLVTLANNWNWVGYYGRHIASVTDAFAGMSPENGDIVKGKSGMTYFNVYEWTGSLVAVEPGVGYMVKNTSGDEKKFSYPAATVVGARIESTERSAVHGDAQSSVFRLPSSVFTPIDYHDYYGNAIMSARAVKSGKPVVHAEVAVFAGDECRTVGVTDNDGIAYLTIPGDETAEMTFLLAVGQEVVQAAKTLDYEPDAIFGSPSNPYVIDFGNADGICDLQIDAKTGAWYDLSGRKIVNRPSPDRKFSKGVYIVNGQKQVIK